MAGPPAMQTVANTPRRRVRFALPVLTFTFIATFIAFAPQFVPPPLALALGLWFLLLYPGLLLEHILFSAREISLTRLPVWFAFSLAVWALPATLLQILGANWFAFRIVFVIALWGLTLAALLMRPRRAPPPLAETRREIFVELGLLALCVVTAVLVARGPRDGDDWMYLQVIQQMMASDPFQIRAASEVRYSIRFAAHVWLFLQAFLGSWLHADVVTLVREILPTLLAPLALVSFYAWGKTFFGNARAALLAVFLQFAIFLTFVRGDAWGLGFFARSAQDKFLVWLVLLPIALMFAWRFLRDAKFTDWFAFGAVILAALWVHPVSLYLLVLALGGFAFFNLLSRARFPVRRWLAVLLPMLPVLLMPLVVRATTAPILFTVNTPQVATYVRMSDGRLLFQAPFYIADPRLLAHPAILFALAVLVWFAPRLRSETRVQFLWGSTLIPLALLFNPYTARVLGEMLTPWQLWRMTWNIPAAFILTEAAMQFRASWRAPNRAQWQFAAQAAALGVIALGAFWLADLNWARSWKNLASTHALDAPVEDMLQYVRIHVQEPALILLPRDMTRYAPAYTYNALVLTDNAHLREGKGGQEIDRFYADQANAKLWNSFLVQWKIEYVVAANDSPQDRYLQMRPQTEKQYRNAGLTLYKIDTRSE